MTDLAMLLDTPAWTSLTTRQALFAKGNGSTLCYDRDVAKFAATTSRSPAALESLAGHLADEADLMIFLQTDPVRLPDNLTAHLDTEGVQMVWHSAPPERAVAHDIIALGNADIPEMLELTALTKPGPFGPRTIEMGDYWGIRIDGRLAAMAGERMNLTGYTEVSGVCCHPDFQGRGLATALSVHTANKIAERGDTPFLHAFADNEGAIRLYEKLGFKLRSTMAVVMAKAE